MGGWGYNIYYQLFPLFLGTKHSLSLAINCLISISALTGTTLKFYLGQFQCKAVVISIKILPVNYISASAKNSNDSEFY